MRTDEPTRLEYAFAGAALLLVALNLAREGAVDAPTPFVWRAPGFPLGNLYFAYWHARATALFTRPVDLLVCGHSTFCASAAFANERAAIIAVHEAGAIRPTSTLLDDDSADALSVRLVRSQLLGGRAMADMGWPGVQRFLNGVT